MRVYNVILFDDQPMDASFASEPMSLNQMFGYSIQAVWVGAPNGIIKLQCSVDSNSGNFLYLADYQTSTTQSTLDIFSIALENAYIINESTNVLSMKNAANYKLGIATLVAGTVTVANTSITANSQIFVTVQVPGGTGGFLQVSAKTIGTGFTITSSSNTDTSTVAWFIIEGF
jgi:hypothetical protein